jgi:hypothetical protein
MLRKYLGVIAVVSAVFVTSGIAAAHGRHSADIATKTSVGVTVTSGTSAPSKDAKAADAKDPTESSGATDQTDATDPAASNSGGVHTAADCLTAAGLDPSTDPTTVGLDAHGLQNALAHVLSNCIKNPQAPGLLVALHHLSLNIAMHAAQGTVQGNATHGHGNSSHGHGNSGSPGTEAS